MYSDNIANTPVPLYNKKIVKRVAIFLSIVVTLGLVAVANIASASTTKTADQVVTETTNKMLDALKQEQQLIKQQPERVYELANQIIMPHVDSQRMSLWALGKHWRKATDEQKRLFPIQFRNLILRTYATALSEYTDETVHYLPLRAEKDATEVTVRTLIKRNSGPNIPVAYRMHQIKNEWKIYDISIDGISLTNNYRRSFSSEIRRHGLDGLIQKLARKNRTLVAKNSLLASNS